MGGGAPRSGGLLVSGGTKHVSCDGGWWHHGGVPYARAQPSRVLVCVTENLNLGRFRIPRGCIAGASPVGAATLTRFSFTFSRSTPSCEKKAFYAALCFMNKEANIPCNIPEDSIDFARAGYGRRVACNGHTPLFHLPIGALKSELPPVPFGVSAIVLSAMRTRAV